MVSPVGPRFLSSHFCNYIAYKITLHRNANHMYDYVLVAELKHSRVFLIEPKDYAQMIAEAINVLDPTNNYPRE